MLAPKSADLDPLAAEIVLLSESLMLEAKPAKEDWRGGSNVVSFVVPDLPLLNKNKALMSTEYSKAPTLKGVVMQSDADEKGLSGILSERKVPPTVSKSLHVFTCMVATIVPLKEMCFTTNECFFTGIGAWTGDSVGGGCEGGTCERWVYPSQMALERRRCPGVQASSCNRQH